MSPMLVTHAVPEIRAPGSTTYVAACGIHLPSGSGDAIECLAWLVQVAGHSEGYVLSGREQK